jgi:cholesterol oxidase
VITSRLRYPGQDNRGFYIEDGGYPHFASWLLEMTDVHSRPVRAAKFLWRWTRNKIGHEPESNYSAELAELLGACVKSSGTLPLLGMGATHPTA